MYERIVVTRYKNEGKKIGLRVALVSDLHNCDYGHLLNLIKKQNPDLILCAGDILERRDNGVSEWNEEKIDKWISSIDKKGLGNRIMWLLDRITEHNGVDTHENVDMASVFLKKTSKIAPTFYSVGNHEWYFLPCDYQMFAKYGITLLDNSDIVAEIGGKKIRIGGLSTRYDMNWLKAFSREEGYKILMCHHPEYYRKAIKNTKYDTFNLIVGGHYHGGQWRVKGRSVYVPRTGLFVKNAVGQFERLVISAGVANTTRFPRYGNPCELVMIDI